MTELKLYQEAAMRLSALARRVKDDQALLDIRTIMKGNYGTFEDGEYSSRGGHSVHPVEKVKTDLEWKTDGLHYRAQGLRRVYRVLAEPVGTNRFRPAIQRGAVTFMCDCAFELLEDAKHFCQADHDSILEGVTAADNELLLEAWRMLRAFRHSMDSSKPFPSLEKLSELISRIDPLMGDPT